MLHSFVTLALTFWLLRKYLAAHSFHRNIFPETFSST